MRPTLSRLSVPRLLVLGLLLREAFSFWTGHPYDFEVWLRNAFFVSQGLTPYAFMNSVPGLSFAYLGQPHPSVGYLPLWSLILAALYRAFAAIPGDNRFVLYFLLKQPTVLGDVLLGYVLYRAVRAWGGPGDAARSVLAFWMVFPYAILISAVWGQFDSLTAFLWVASLLSTRPTRRSLLEGWSIFLKFFPVIFIPYTILAERGFRKARVLLTVAVPAGLTGLIFLVTGWPLGSFEGTIAYQGHGAFQGPAPFALLYALLGPAWFSAYPVAYQIAGWAWIPAVVLASLFAASRFPSTKDQSIVQAILFSTVLFFLFRTEVNEQYLVYLLPILLIDVVLWHPERKALFQGTWIFGLAYLLVNNDFLLRFLGPAVPGIVDFTMSLDNGPIYGPLRTVGLYVLSAILIVHFVQVALVVADPAHSPTPWILRLLPRSWSRASPSSAVKDAFR